MQTIKVESRSGVGIVTLARPRVRNTISLEMVAELVAAVDEVESRDDVHSVVFTGEGSAFCAGADVQQLEVGDITEFRGIYDAFLRVAQCRLPTIAAVNGPAVGAGLNLALACDVRVAAREARFVARFPEIGLHPGGGHIWMLERAVGSELTAAMLHFGVEVDGEEAPRCGLAYACVEGEVLLGTSLELAAAASRVPRALSERIKESRRLLFKVPDHESAVELELEAQAWSAAQPFFRETLAAFTAGLSERRRGGS